MPPAIVDVIPAPTYERWGVCLHQDSAVSNTDKEYRIVVDGATTVFQWGRREARGECKVVAHNSPAAAVTAARRQWAAKERRGYWPVTGVVEIPVGRAIRGSMHGADDVIYEIQRGYTDAAQQLLATGTAGNQLLLVEPPRSDSPLTLGTRLNVIALLGRCAVVPATASVRVVAVDAPTAALVTAVCPIALPVATSATRAGTDAAAVVATLVTDADTDTGDRYESSPDGSRRAEFASLLAAARSIAGDTGIVAATLAADAASSDAVSAGELSSLLATAQALTSPSAGVPTAPAPAR